jgi:uncharacterized protein (DUF2267 family)
MSATGLEVFDRTLQTTNIWLGEIMNEIGPDRQVAWHALRAVLHALRDRLSVEQATNLGAQLPMMVRGAYYDQWQPADKPERQRHVDEFIARVAEGLQSTRALDPELATRVVFKVISKHVSQGQVGKIKQALPHELRALWPDGGNPGREPASAGSEA